MRGALAQLALAALLSARALSAAAAALPAQEEDPRALLRRGVDHYAAGDFAAAAADFRGAAQLAPDDSLAHFDHGAAALQLGDHAIARAALMEAARAEDSALAASARYNLGVLGAAEARSAIGADALDLPAEQRDPVVALLHQATRAFEECLELEPGHADARHNLEMLRSFRAELEDGWRERDRAAARAEKDPFAYLGWLKERQESLRDQIDEQLGGMPSPAWAQELRDAARAQRELAEDTALYSAKLRELFSGMAEPGEELPEAMAGALQAFEARIAESGAEMERAAGSLDAADAAAAEPAQAGAAAGLEQLFRALAPFELLLQKGIQEEKALVGTARALSGGEAPDPAPRWPRLVERQASVETWCNLLIAHAEQRLAQLLASAPPPPPALPGDPGEAEGPEAPPDPAAGQRAMFEKALEVGPEARSEAGKARERLEQEDAAGALPHLERTLELLEEIARENPQQDPSQDPGESSEDESEQEPPEDPEQPEEQPEQPDPAEEPPDPEENPEEQQPEQEQAEPPPPLTPEEVEKLLQRALEREQEYKDFLKKLEALRSAQARGTQKDW